MASVSLFPKPPTKGISSSGNKLLIFFKAAILNIYGFFKITSRFKDLIILSGLIITGPSGILKFSSCLIFFKYSLVSSAYPIGLAVKYKISYPLFLIAV
jgi:hypothetical protein